MFIKPQIRYSVRYTSFMCIKIVSVIFLLCFSFSGTNAQQININRIEQMSNNPSPYEMRNWKMVAAGYDSLVFDLNRTGQYLPLSWINY